MARRTPDAAAAAMFVAGPPVVNALGHNVTKRELGGWEIQTKAGGVDDAVDTEEEAFERVRRFLSYLPSSKMRVEMIRRARALLSSSQQQPQPQPQPGLLLIVEKVIRR